MGIAFPHESGFTVDRPNGSGDNLLLVFKTEAFIRTGNGNITVPPDSAVVFSKGAPQIYGSSGGEYINHWVHFDCNETDIFFEKIKLRFNEPFAAASVQEAENVLKMLSVESVSSGSGKAVCCDLLLRLLMAKLCGGDERRDRSPHSEALRQLRADIYSMPSQNYTVESMAQRLMLSVSYFQALYKQEFGVSCYEDVICAKISAAKYYLKNTELSVCGIAELCGYENDVHFIRQFRKRTGMTALEYRHRSRRK